jgi:hypothetical protein
VLAAGEDPAQQAFLLRWSRCRPAHQAGAQRCHGARRAREQEARALAAPAPQRAGDLAQEILSDAEWARVQPLLPRQTPAVGRPRHDDRTVLTGILWVLRTPAPWREMPPAYGKATTCCVRITRPLRRRALVVVDDPPKHIHPMDGTSSGHLLSWHRTLLVQALMVARLLSLCPPASLLTRGGCHSCGSGPAAWATPPGRETGDRLLDLLGVVARTKAAEDGQRSLQPRPRYLPPGRHGSGEGAWC